MTRAAIVLAAGKGTRFRSEQAKVLHPVAGRTMLRWVLESLRPLELERVVVVVGHQADAVRAEAEAADLPGLTTVVQDEQRGTGHAARVAVEQGGLEAAETVLVLPGDVPLLESEPLERLLASAAESAATILSFELADPTGYGRIVRDSSGAVSRIVEHRDASEAERAITEVNSSIYAFDRAALTDELGRLSSLNEQGEEYLTDVVAPLAEREAGVDAVSAAADTVAGVNDRAQLAEAGVALRARILEGLMAAGATVVDPATTYVEADVVVGTDAVVMPGTHLEGATRIGSRACVGPDSRLVDAEVGDDATIAYSVVLGARIGPGADVGPFTYLRGGTDLGPATKAGAFVEMKNASVGEGSKVPHLSYIGDAEIGRGANVGAATVTANYDGFAKHRTVIGDGARIGSDTMLVAPVRVGIDAYTGAGSVITTDVPDGALGVERNEQRTIEGYSEHKRAKHERGG